MSKVLIRSQVKQYLNSIPLETRVSKSKELTNKVLNGSLYSASKRIAVYISLPTEPDTSFLIKRFLSDGKSVFVPQVVDQVHPGILMKRLDDINDLQKWVPNKWGIKQPTQHSDAAIDDSIQEGGIDLLIAPGLAFTRDGQRLGRGGGYYDRYLQWYKQQSLLNKCNYPVIVALAFEEQIVLSIPKEVHDISVDEVFIA